MLARALVTIVPPLFVCIFARVALKVKFIDLSGLLAGSTVRSRLFLRDDDIQLVKSPNQSNNETSQQ
jgi:uncharacterized transporter YbjL